MSGHIGVRQVSAYLERMGWHQYKAVEEANEKEGAVVTGWLDESGQPHDLIIDPIIEQRCLIFRVPNVLTAPPDDTPSDRLSGLLVMLGYLNQRLLLGRWCFDPGDGEVSFKMGVPIDDDLTFQTFVHCMLALGTAVEANYRTLDAILRGRITLSRALENSSPELR